ncbi:MAG: 4Fe-4S binding protein [Calditerrivibrio sp.]|nr:4Fe-4S binding protein [Calditerrivibrio sp.]
MEKSKYNYQDKRAFVRKILIALFLLVPFIRINGHSFFRFDIPDLIFYFFGFTVPINNFFFILLVTLFLTFAFITMTLMFGRIWCGWICPQSVTMEVTSFVDKVKKGENSKKILYFFLLIIISFVIATNMVFYFVDPYQFFRKLFSEGYIHPVTFGFILTLAIIIFLDIYLVRFRFCATVCPYSMIQSVLYDDHTLAVYMIPETKDDCIKCNSCVRVCSTGIDIRQGLNSACINCAKCIDACEKVMGKKGKKSLFAYLYGPNNEKKFTRPTVLIGLVATSVFLVASIVAAVHLKPYKVEFLTNPKFYPRFTEGYAVNGFQLIIENYSSKEKKIEIFLSEKSKNIDVVIEPAKYFSAKPKEKKEENIFLKIPSEISEKNQLIDLEIGIKDEEGKIIFKKITFRKPFVKRSSVKK